MKYTLILILFFLTITGCKVENKISFKTSDIHTVLCIGNKKDSAYSILEKNILKLSDYTKFDCNTITNIGFNEHVKINPNVKLVVIGNSVELTEEAIDTIVNYTINGGTVFIPKPNGDARLSFLQGLKEDNNLKTNRTATGFYFHTSVIPGFKYKTYDHPQVHLGYRSNSFKPNINILVGAQNEQNYPLVIENKIGVGKSIFFNSNVQLDKLLRAFIFLPMAKALEGVPYPIANVSTVFLDDFTSPISKNKIEPEKTEFNITNTDFVNRVWWPNMIKLAKKHKIKYTAVSVFDSGNNISPPFTASKWNFINGNFKNNKVYLPKKTFKNIIEEKYELGFQGYNHVSLLSNDWNGNPNHMVKALESVSEKWYLQNLGNIPVNYVPPSNLIDSIGLVSLKKGLPFIQNMSSIYLGVLKDGGNREFDDDPYEPKLFNYPRVSEGYDREKSKEFNIFSLYLFTGIWTHFVHPKPEEVYQIPKPDSSAINYIKTKNKETLELSLTENKNRQTELLSEFDDLLSYFKKSYPFQQYKTVKEAVPLVKKWRRNSVNRYEIGNKIFVDGFEDLKTSFWNSYISIDKADEYQEYLEYTNMNYSKIAYADGFLFTIKLDKPRMELINVMQEKLTKNKSTLELINQNQILYSDYMLLSGTINDLILQNKLRQATIMLERKMLERGMLESDNINTRLFFPYAKYMTLDNRSNETWEFLLKYCSINPSRENYQFVKKLHNKIEEPEQIVKNKWLYRFIELEPNNLKYYTTYIEQNQNNPMYFQNTKEMYQQINRLEPTAQNRLDYLMFLKENLLEEFLYEVTFEDIANNDDLKKISTDISWLYADYEDYKKAILFSPFTDEINDETMFTWYLFDNNIKEVRAKYYDLFINYLLVNNKEEAYKEIDVINPNENFVLRKKANKITWDYANNKNYEKAYEWSKQADSISVLNQFDWLYQLNKTDEIKIIYDSIENGNNKTQALNKTTEEMDKIHFFMSNIYIEENNVVEAERIVDKIENEETKQERKKLLSEMVFNKPFEDQKELFNKETEDELTSNVYQIERNVGVAEVKLSLDRFNVNAIENKLGYFIKTKKQIEHRIYLSQKSLFKISEVQILNNKNLFLMGAGYELFNNVKNKPWNYSFGLGIEKGDEAYYNVNSRVSYKKNDIDLSVEIDHKPVQNNIAYNLNIYKSLLSLNSEWLPNQKQTIQANFTQEYFSDDYWQSTLSGSYYLNYNIKKKSMISPLAQVSYSLSDNNTSEGLPYFSIDSRFFAGGGIKFMYDLERDIDINNDIKHLFFTAESTYFRDTFFNSFIRVRSNLNLKFKKQSYLSFSATYFSQKNIFSNEFNIKFKLVF